MYISDMNFGDVPTNLIRDTITKNISSYLERLMMIDNSFVEYIDSFRENPDIMCRDHVIGVYSRIFSIAIMSQIEQTNQIYENRTNLGKKDILTQDFYDEILLCKIYKNFNQINKFFHFFDFLYITVHPIKDGKIDFTRQVTLCALYTKNLGYTSVLELFTIDHKYVRFVYGDGVFGCKGSTPEGYMYVKRDGRNGYLYVQAKNKYPYRSIEDSAKLLRYNSTQTSYAPWDFA